MNDGLIAVRGSATDATDYEFVDGSNAAYYMLEDLDTSGVATRHGPIGVGGGAAGASVESFSLYLPFLQR